MEHIDTLITGCDTKTVGLLAERLKKDAPGMAVDWAESCEDCAEVVRSKGADCVVACCMHGVDDWPVFLDSVREAGADTPVILLFEQAQAGMEEEARERGAFDALPSSSVTEDSALLVRTIEHAARLGRVEAALHEERNNLRVILDSIGESIILQDKDFKILFQNRANIELIGAHAGEDCFRAFEGRDELCEICPILDSFKDGKVHREEKHVPLEDRTMYVELTGSSLHDLHGNVVGGVKVVRDVTGRKLMEKQKADLVAMVSHDLKSPLSVIQGYAELIIGNKKGTDDIDTYEMASAVRRSCNKLLGLVEDFLTMSRMESGDFSINPVPLDAGVVVREIAEELSPVADIKGVKLGVEAAEGLPPALLDRTLLERAVSNLLRNALAYTPKGGKVEVSVYMEPGGNGELVVSVKDTGPGIPEAERARVFDKYYRSPKYSQPGGSGLGLAVVKAVARAHGGSAELESEVGKGSTFRIRVPVSGPG